MKTLVSVGIAALIIAVCALIEPTQANTSSIGLDNIRTEKTVVYPKGTQQGHNWFMEMVSATDRGSWFCEMN